MPEVKFNYHVFEKRYMLETERLQSCLNQALTMSGYISAGNLNNSLNNGVDVQE